MAVQEILRKAESVRFLKKVFEKSQAKRSVYKHGHVRANLRADKSFCGEMVQCAAVCALNHVPVINNRTYSY